MTTVGDVTDWLERFAPARLAEPWDNVGLIWGDPAAAVERVMTCLTVTPTTAAEAIDEHAELIVSHHPILFREVKKIRADWPETGYLWKLARSGVAVASPHTAFDNTQNGINDLLCARLGLLDVGPLRRVAGCGRPASAQHVPSRLSSSRRRPSERPSRRPHFGPEPAGSGPTRNVHSRLPVKALSSEPNRPIPALVSVAGGKRCASSGWNSSARHQSWPACSRRFGRVIRTRNLRSTFTRWNDSRPGPPRRWGWPHRPARRTAIAGATGRRCRTGAWDHRGRRGRRPGSAGRERGRRLRGRRRFSQGRSARGRGCPSDRRGPVPPGH